MNAIQRWLGITALREELFNARCDLETIRREVREQGHALRSATAGLGVVLSKLRPDLAVSEFDPDRVAESDAIGEAVIKRLKAEERARRHTEGKL